MGRDGIQTARSGLDAAARAGLLAKQGFVGAATARLDSDAGFR